MLFLSFWCQQHTVGSFPVKKQHCSWLCLLLNILNIISDHPWRNTYRNSSTSTNTVTTLPRLCVKPALENVIKLSDKQESACDLHIYHEQSSILFSKIFHYPHFLPKKKSSLLELTEMAVDIDYKISVSTCAGGRMRHPRGTEVKTQSVNEDDHYSEPSSRSVCPWTWIMLTMWKYSRMIRTAVKVWGNCFQKTQGRDDSREAQGKTSSHSNPASICSCSLLCQQIHTYYGCSLGESYILNEEGRPRFVNLYAYV